jgi:hypothetical protein
MRGRTSFMDIILVMVIGFIVIRSIKILKNNPNGNQDGIMKMLEKISDKINK